MTQTSHQNDGPIVFLAVLMKTVKDDIRRESPRATPMDAVMFFKVAGFFTAYQKERLQAAKVSV